MNVKKKVWYQIDTVGGSRRQKISAVLVLTNHGSQPEFADLVAARESATTRILSAQRQHRSVSVKFDKMMGVITYKTR